MAQCPAVKRTLVNHGASAKSPINTRRYAVVRDGTRNIRGPGSKIFGYVHLKFGLFFFHFGNGYLVVRAVNTATRKGDVIIAAR